MKFPAFSTLAIACAALFLAQPGLRAQGLYLNYPDVTGSVVTAGYVGQIEVVSYAFGVGRGVSITGGNVTTTAPNISAISFTAALDPKAYPGLFEASLSGDKEIGIVFSSVANSDPAFVPLRITLDGLISGLSTSQAGSDSAGGFMQIEITPTKITIDTQILNNDGSVTNGTPVTWDLQAATP